MEELSHVDIKLSFTVGHQVAVGGELHLLGLGQVGGVRECHLS